MASRMAARARTEAIEGLLARRGGRREFVPLRRAFVQARTAGGGAGPLAAFVSGRQRRALDLYLFIHALASTEPWDTAPGWRTWALVLGMPETSASQVSISKALRWLERAQLIRSERDGARRRSYLLDESGSGAAYCHPARSDAPDYFKVPYAYWRYGWHDRLSLPATSVLLIALSLGEAFLLPLDAGARWYGISRDTLRRGLRELTREGVLRFSSHLRQAPRSPTGQTEERRYTLQGAFAPHARR